MKKLREHLIEVSLFLFALVLMGLSLLARSFDSEVSSMLFITTLVVLAPIFLVYWQGKDTYTPEGKTQKDLFHSYAKDIYQNFGEQWKEKVQRQIKKSESKRWFSR